MAPLERLLSKLYITGFRDGLYRLLLAGVQLASDQGTDNRQLFFADVDLLQLVLKSWLLAELKESAIAAHLADSLEIDDKFGAFADIGLDVDVSGHLLDETLADRQAKADSKLVALLMLIDFVEVNE